jgi:hypothetical protein
MGIFRWPFLEFGGDRGLCCFGEREGKAVGRGEEERGLVVWRVAFRVFQERVRVCAAVVGAGA